MARIKILDSKIFNMLASLTGIDFLMCPDIGEDRGEAFFLFHNAMQDGFVVDKGNDSFSLSEDLKPVFQILKNSTKIVKMTDKLGFTRCLYIQDNEICMLEKSERDKNSLKLTLLKRDELGEELFDIELIPSCDSDFQRDMEDARIFGKETDADTSSMGNFSRLEFYDLSEEIKGLPVSVIELISDGDVYYMREVNTATISIYRYDEFIKMI